MSDREQENEKRETLADIEAEVRELSRSGELAIGASYCDSQQTVFGKQISIYFSEIADRIEAAWKRERAKVEADSLAVGGIIEAARTAEKSSAVGHAAAMSEAMELALIIGDWCCAQTDDPLECCEYSCIYQVEPYGEAGADCPWKKIRAAISAPPRNCDVGTVEEQTKRYDAFCNAHFNDSKDGGDCHKCPLAERKTWSCQLAWSQMPYEAEEGGEK